MHGRVLVQVEGVGWLVCEGRAREIMSEKAGRELATMLTTAVARIRSNVGSKRSDSKVGNRAGATCGEAVAAWQEG